MIVSFNANAVTVRRKRRDSFICALWDGVWDETTIREACLHTPAMKLEHGSSVWVELPGSLNWNFGSENLNGLAMVTVLTLLLLAPVI